jgi:hypothetical protein
MLWSLGKLAQTRWSQWQTIRTVSYWSGCEAVNTGNFPSLPSHSLMLVAASRLTSSLKIERQILCDRNRGLHEIDLLED